MEKRKKLKKKKIKILAFIGLLGLVILCCLLFSFNKSKKLENKKKTEDISQEEPYQSKLPSLRKLYQNDEIQLELSIPSLDINELIVKGQDNVYYLDHDIYKNSTIFGAIFMDYRIPDVDKAQQLNIYGHNTELQDIPFKKLENYEQEDFFKKNQEIFIKTDKASYTYNVFSVLLVPKSYDEHMIVSLEKEDFVKHVSLMRENHLFDTQEEIKKDDHILLLQTCLFNPEQFLIVMAKRV